MINRQNKNFKEKTNKEDETRKFQEFYVVRRKSYKHGPNQTSLLVIFINTNIESLGSLKVTEEISQLERQL